MNNKKIIQLYNITDYAKNKGVHVTTVHDWINAGKVPVYKSPKGNSFLNAFDTPENK